MSEDVNANVNVDIVYDALVNNTFEGLDSLELLHNVDIEEEDEVEISDSKVIKEKSGDGFSFKLNESEYRYVSDKISSEQLKSKTMSIARHGDAIAWLNANSVCYYGGKDKRKPTSDVKRHRSANESVENYVVNQLKDMTGSLQSIAGSEGFAVDYGLGENDNDIGPISLDSPFLSIYAHPGVTTIANLKNSETFKVLSSLEGASNVQFMENGQGIYDISPLSCMYVKFSELANVMNEALKTMITCPKCGFTDAENNFPGGCYDSAECPECHEIFNHAKSEAIALIKNRFTFVGMLDQDEAILETAETLSISQGAKDELSTCKLGNLYGTDGGNYTVVGNHEGTLTIVDDNDNMYDVDKSDFVLLNPFLIGT